MKSSYPYLKTKMNIFKKTSLTVVEMLVFSGIIGTEEAMTERITGTLLFVALLSLTSAHAIEGGTYVMGHTMPDGTYVYRHYESPVASPSANRVSPLEASKQKSVSQGNRSHDFAISTSHDERYANEVWKRKKIYDLTDY